MIRKEKLYNRLPGLFNHGRICVDLHPLGNRSNAGRKKSAGALYFDDTDPARPEGNKMLVIAEGGDIDAQLLRCLEHRGSAGNLHVFSINCKADGHNPLFLLYGVERAHLKAHIALGAQLLIDIMELLSLSGNG
jgi:hypothetical protein